MDAVSKRCSQMSNFLNLTSERLKLPTTWKLNFEETIAIFRNHTWYAQGGTNLSIPSSHDYKQAASLAGRATVQSGALDKTRALPQTKAAQRMYGRIVGLKYGGLSLTREHQSAAGRRGGLKAVESGQIQELGRIQGRKNVESGRWDLIRRRGVAASLAALTPEQRKMNGSKSGRKNAESGHCARIAKLGGLEAVKRGTGIHSFTSEQRAALGRKVGPSVCHIRWHVNRNIVIQLSLCQQAKQRNHKHNLSFQALKSGAIFI